MADIVTLSKAAAQAILNQSVVSASINSSGHIIFKKYDNTTIDGGDFSAFITSSIGTQVGTEVGKKSIASASIDANGNLIFKKGDNTTINAGNFGAYIDGAVSDEVSAELDVRVAGNVFDKGNVTGAMDFKVATASTLVNATFKATLTGDVTINASTAFPASPKAGTQFAVRFTQDANGNRKLTLTGIKKSQGVLTLSTGGGAIDIVVFYYDGNYWYAGLMGDNFS